jgi:hypothetical protein
MDRVITLHLGHYDRATEVLIVSAKSQLAQEPAAHIVDVVRALRSENGAGVRPTIRAAIAIAGIVASTKAKVELDDEVFRWACRDVLSRDLPRVTRDGEPLVLQRIDEIVIDVLTAARRASAADPSGGTPKSDLPHPGTSQRA